MRRRRKTKYTWFPSDGAIVQNANQTFTEELIAFSAGFSITSGADSSVPVGFVTSCIADFGRTDEDSKNNSLADLMGSEYLLKRLVGKLFVEATAESLGPNGGTQNPEDLVSVLVTAGFFVAPYGTDATSGAIAEDFPVGQNSQVVIPIYNPLAGITARQPWIWRRTWLLTAGGCQSQWQSQNNDTTHLREISAATGVEVGTATFPTNNVGYGSVMDGPHVDAKTGRRVRKHERLWLAVAAVKWPESTIIDPDKWGGVNIRAVLDIRALGALRRARNRSSFE